jgi:nitrite reductase/ring-hydroxylating ferredoxin subunit
MTDYVEIAQRGDIPAEHGLTVTVDHAAVALFDVAGQLFAIDAACLCCGSDVGSGKLNSTHVVCSGCGWQYDLASGCVQGVAGLRLDTFEVTTDGTRVLLRNRFSSRPGRV